MQENISIHVQGCFELFHSVFKASEIAHASTPGTNFLRNDHTQLKVRSGNIGAHRTGRSSLDYRLRDSSHIQTQIIQLLNDLGKLLEDAAAILSGDKIPWDQLGSLDGLDTDAESESDDGSLDTELDQISVDVADVVTCLLRLSSTIRDPAPHDKFAEAQSIETSDCELSDVQHVQSKFSSIDSSIATRLGKAISNRRQYFKYRKVRHAKLAHGPNQDSAIDTTHNKPQQILHSSISEHLDESSKSTELTPVVLEDDETSDTGSSETSSSETESESRQFPPLPNEAFKGPFQCPYCSMVINATDGVSWK